MRPVHWVSSILAGAVLAAGFVFLLLWLAPPSSGPAHDVRAPAVDSARAAPPAQVQPAARGPAPSPAVAETGRLEDAACWFAVPEDRRARCGSVIVPEQWGVAGSRLLRLRFVVFEGDGGGARDPIIYINGGPGEPAGIDAASIDRWWGWLRRSAWLRDRDLVVFDQRGVGLSEPAMTCPELAQAGHRAFLDALSLDASRALWASAAAACDQRLTAAGVKIDRYNMASIVRDLQALIRVLGYRSWNLLGTSFGTKVALEFLRASPEGTRSVILDSVYPPGAAAYVDSAAAAAASLDGLVKECADDPGCRSSFPAVKENFIRLVQRAAQAPLAVKVEDPTNGAPRDAMLDDGKLVEVLFYAFYDTHLIADLPSVITAAAAGDLRPLEPLAGMALENYVSTSVSHGLFLSVECHDELPINDPDKIDRAAASEPLFRKFALSTLPLMACSSWLPRETASASETPVTSDVPILMLSGALDPATPPEWARAAAATLPHAVLLSFRGIGHGVLAASGCADRIAGRFLAAPLQSPIDDCLLAVGPPQFVAVPTKGRAP